MDCPVGLFLSHFSAMIRSIVLFPSSLSILLGISIVSSRHLACLLLFLWFSQKSPRTHSPTSYWNCEARVPSKRCLCHWPSKGKTQLSTPRPARTHHLIRTMALAGWFGASVWCRRWHLDISSSDERPIAYSVITFRITIILTKYSTGHPSWASALPPFGSLTTLQDGSYPFFIITTVLTIHVFLHWSWSFHSPFSKQGYHLYIAA